jgi:signal transduction histidine kinase
MRSLRTWLALGLLLALGATAAAAAGGYLAARAWQTHQRDDRLAAVKRLLASTVDADELSRRLSARGVEAMLTPLPDKQAVPQSPDAALREKKRLVQGQVATPGLQALLDGPDGKRALQRDYDVVEVEAPRFAGTLYVRHDSAAVRWAVALSAAVLALAAALALIVSLLSRWVLNPLATLAADADRIAGGELAVAPVDTRAREVAQVGDAMQGMAGALGQALGASTAAERDRRFLVTAIAHDLRTPLFTLRGSLEAIECGLDDGAALARAQAKAAHLDRLVGDLFSYARAEYAADVREGAPLDVAELAARAADGVDPGPIALELRADGPAPRTGDPVALERALTNVVENAVRHARTRVDVVVHHPNGNGAVVVEVTDDGPGFAPEDLPHVFEPLFRGDRARHSNGAGAGLGLAIARRLARAQGGEISAENRAQGGARITLTLPGQTRSASIQP